MKTLLIIETAHGGLLFSISYFAAILVAAGITLYSGLKKGYPRSAWVLILITGLLFFIIGEKMASYSPLQWAGVFNRFIFPPSNKITILGGIIGLMAGLILAKKVLGFKRPVLDHFAIALPVSMAISRIGCLMAGCCFGTPTNLPWGIKYDASSMVYHVHQMQGLIQSNAETSLAVHPVQMYQIIGCLIIALIVWKSRKQWKVNGDLFIFSVLSYALLRFLIEFVRDPESSFMMTQVFLGMKIIQWLLLTTIIIGTLLLIIRETKAKSGTKLFQSFKETYLKQVLLTLFICSIVFIWRRWFALTELFTITFFLIPAIILLCAKLNRRVSVAGFRWVVPVMLVCCFSFMSQKSSTNGNEDDKITFTSAGFVGMIGHYSEDLVEITKNEWVSGGCNGGGYRDIDTATIGTTQRTFYQGGLDFSYNKWKNKYKKLKVGARLFFGSESGSIYEDHPSGILIGLSPYIGLDWKWFGFTGGFSVGQMKLPIGMGSIHQHSGEVISKNYKNFYIWPNIDLRVGPYDIAYLELGIPSLFPSTYDLFHIGLGSGLGKTNGTKLAIGMFDNGFYLQFKYPVKNTIFVEALYGDNFLSGIKSERVVSIGASYRFFPKKKN